MSDVKAFQYSKQILNISISSTKEINARYSRDCKDMKNQKLKSLTTKQYYRKHSNDYHFKSTVFLIIVLFCEWASEPTSQKHKKWKYPN